jgi:lipopolysaccharide/colanic/teichoic acid biosynthesis glycosyltransferase
MISNAEKEGKAVWACEGDGRVTRTGKFLRKYRLDELPQAINVIKGDMSFVGPRPERPEFLAELSNHIPYFKERHVLKPGLTGWAQLNYPYGSSMDDAYQKQLYDMYYVKNHSLFLDCLIILQTVEVILFGKGAR